MLKPNENLIKLCSMDYIKSIDISYRQTGVDTASTYVTITSLNGITAKGLWSTYSSFLELRVTYNSVAYVLDECIRDVAKWRAYEKQNKNDLAEFERLKNKLGK